MKPDIKIQVAANITYSGFTYNTRLFVEYQHTGEQYFKNNHHYTSDKDIAENWKKEGKKVTTKPGYYFIKRMAIPTINAKGENDIWYIDNEGDYCRVNKASKYWNKVHKQLSTNQ